MLPAAVVHLLRLNRARQGLIPRILAVVATAMANLSKRSFLQRKGSPACAPARCLRVSLRSARGDARSGAARAKGQCAGAARISRQNQGGGSSSRSSPRSCSVISSPNGCLQLGVLALNLCIRLWCVSFSQRRPPNFCHTSLLILTFPI